MSAARFGELVTNDKHFVYRLRSGRGLHSTTIDKARAIIGRYDDRHPDHNHD